jgi:hypothetical protein
LTIGARVTAKVASAVGAPGIECASERRKVSGFGKLPDGWADLNVEFGVDVNKPGIYEWRIEGVGTYIGKYTHIRRPLREYTRNVARRLARRLAGQWYRKNNTDGFRRIHLELAKAVESKWRITLTILENVAPEELNQREQALIQARGATLNGPHPVSGAAGEPVTDWVATAAGTPRPTAPPAGTDWSR